MKKLITIILLIFNATFSTAQLSNAPQVAKKISKNKYSNQVGIYFGSNKIRGDVRSQYTWVRPMHAKNTLCIGAVYNYNLFRNLISLNFNGQYGSASGYNWLLSDGFRAHLGNPYNDGYTNADGVKTPAYPATEVVAYNFKTNYITGGANLKVATPSFKKIQVFIITGASLMFSKQTKIDAYNNISGRYYFSGYASEMNEKLPYYAQKGNRASRKYVDKYLIKMFDGEYESNAETIEANKTKGFPLLLSMGIGAQYKFSRKFSLQFQYQRSISSSDLLDGQQWQETFGNPLSKATLEPDGIRAYTLGILYNFK